MKNKYWVESSFDHEDEEKIYDEFLVVVVDYGEEVGTQTIATFDNVKDRANLEELVKSFNESK